MNENLTYTKIPHVLSEIFIKKGLTATEMHVLEMIARYTFGFHREASQLSLSFIAKGTGLDTKSVKRALKKLIEKNLVIVTAPYTHSTPRELKINLFAQGGDKFTPRAKHAPSEGDNMPPQGGGNHAPQENKTINKNINKYSYPKYGKYSSDEDDEFTAEMFGSALKRAKERE